MVEQILIFLFGAIFGSAANALIDRLPKGKSWLKGRSECDKCKHKLGWKDLVPVVGYVGLRGRCRYCHSPIPVRNLVVEVVMGVGFVVIWYLSNLGNLSYLGEVSQKILIAGILWVTVIIAVMDWETKLVSEVMVLVWGGLAILYSLSNLSILSNLGGIALGAGIIGGIWLVSRGRAMGLGDVEIAAVMGWWLGWQNLLVALWIAFVSGAMVGLVKVVNKKAKMKSEMAFGPFLVLGAWIALVWGEMIWKVWAP